MIKVCHMTSAHRQEDVRIFHKECCSLAQAGYEVYLVSPGETYDKNGVHIIGIQKGANRLDRILHASKRAYQAALDAHHASPMMEAIGNWMRTFITSMTRSCCPTV